MFRLCYAVYAAKWASGGSAKYCCSWASREPGRIAKQEQHEAGLTYVCMNIALTLKFNGVLYSYLLS